MQCEINLQVKAVIGEAPLHSSGTACSPPRTPIGLVAACRWPEQCLTPDAPGRAAGAPCSCLHAVQREHTIPKVGTLSLRLLKTPGPHTHVSPPHDPFFGFLTSQAAALGRHLAKQYPGLLSAAISSQQKLLHCSTAVRAARTAAIALAQFPGAASTGTGQEQLPAVVQSSPELLELSQGIWVSLAGCVGVSQGVWIVVLGCVQLCAVPVLLLRFGCMSNHMEAAECPHAAAILVMLLLVLLLHAGGQAQAGVLHTRGVEAD